VSGLVAAHLLQRRHDVTVFEAGAHVGGHAHTVDVEIDGHRFPVDVEIDGHRFPVDTGFIVYNEVTYPNFVRLLERLGTPSQPTEMSFSVRCEKSGLEYGGSSLNALFAQRSNLLRWSFYRMIRDILRFHREARAMLSNGYRPPTLRHFFRDKAFSNEFVNQYIVPMGAAIWSSRPEGMLDFPAAFFVRFFENHGLLGVDDQLDWRVVRNGSRNYVGAITRDFRGRILTETPVLGVARDPEGVDLRLPDGSISRFDHVVLALHGDRALRILDDPTAREREILDAFEYQANAAVLHSDASVLPRRRLARASWNYHIPEGDVDRVAVTYDLSRLQGLDTPEPVCLTLNRHDLIDPAKRIREVAFDHPVFTPRSVEAQARHAEISGRGRTHYCGAYWGNGFHEDGVNSALEVCRAFGEELR
jgi:predicted NAD/FAD-binding protein